MFRPILRIVGVIISGAGSAMGASVAGQGGIAIGVLALTGLALLGDLLAAMLRDHTFNRIAIDSNRDARVLRDLNIREAIRSGQLTSRDAASLLDKEPLELTPSKRTGGPHRPPAQPGPVLLSATPDSQQAGPAL